MTTIKNAEGQQLSPLEQWADNSMLFFSKKDADIINNEKLVGSLIMPYPDLAPF